MQTDLGDARKPVMSKLFDDVLVDVARHDGDRHGAPGATHQLSYLFILQTYASGNLVTLVALVALVQYEQVP